MKYVPCQNFDITEKKYSLGDNKICLLFFCSFCKILYLSHLL